MIDVDISAQILLLFDGGVLAIQTFEDMRHFLLVLYAGSLLVSTFIDLVCTTVILGTNEVFSHDAHNMIVIAQN